jgi:hypothetical protein
VPSPCWVPSSTLSPRRSTRPRRTEPPARPPSRPPSHPPSRPPSRLQTEVVRSVAGGRRGREGESGDWWMGWAMEAIVGITKKRINEGNGRDEDGRRGVRTSAMRSSTALSVDLATWQGGGSSRGTGRQRRRWEAIGILYLGPPWRIIHVGGGVRGDRPGGL